MSSFTLNLYSLHREPYFIITQEKAAAAAGTGEYTASPERPQ